MSRRTSVAIAAVLSAATLLAGCGGTSSGAPSGTNESSAAPKTELRDATNALSAGSALTTTLSLKTTSANLVHLSGERGSTPLTQHEADLIAGAKITVEVTAASGKALKDGSVAAGTNEIALTGSSGDTTYVSAVIADKTVFLKVDLKDLLGLAGDASEYQTLVARTAAMPPFVKAFVNDQYIAVSFATIAELEAFLKSAGAGAEVGRIPTFSQLVATWRKLYNAVLATLSVTRTTSGTTDQLALTGSTRALVNRVVSTVRSAVGASGLQLTPNSTNQVPSKVFKLDASVAGGALSKLDVDLGQFSPHHQDKLPAQATFARSAPTVSAPSGATQASLSDLLLFFTALATPTSESSSGGGATPAPSEVGSSGATP